MTREGNGERAPGRSAFSAASRSAGAATPGVPQLRARKREMTGDAGEARPAIGRRSDAGQPLSRVQDRGSRLSRCARAEGAARMPARDAAHDPEAQGHRAPPGRHQGPHQTAHRGARGAEEGWSARRAGAGHPARGGGAGLGAGAAQLREVRLGREAHRSARGDRPLPVHHAAPAARDAALGGHPLSARGPAADHPRSPGAVDRERAPARRGGACSWSTSPTPHASIAPPRSQTLLAEKRVSRFSRTGRLPSCRPIRRPTTTIRSRSGFRP